MNRQNISYIWLSTAAGICGSILVDLTIMWLKSIAFWPLTDSSAQMMVVLFAALLILSFFALFTINRVSQRWQGWLYFFLNVCVIIAVKGIWEIMSRNP